MLGVPPWLTSTQNSIRARCGAIFAEHYLLFRGTPTRDVARSRVRDALRVRGASLGARPPTTTSIGSAQRSPPRTSVRARFTNASTSRRSQRRTARSIPLSTTRRCERPAGAGACFRPTGPIRWSIRIFDGLPPATSRDSVRSRAAILAPGAATLMRTASDGHSSSSTALRQPTTVTPARARPTSRVPRRQSCSICVLSGDVGARRRGTSSEARC